MNISKSIIFIFCITFLYNCGTGEVPFNLGRGYILDYSANSYFYISNINIHFYLPAHITKFGFDNKFIVAEQLPIDKVLEYNINYKRDLSKEVLQQYKIRFYYIIDKTKDKDNLTGPLSYNEYIKQKKILGCTVKLNKAFPSSYMHYLNQGNTFTIIKDYYVYQDYLDSLNQTLEK